MLVPCMGDARAKKVDALIAGGGLAGLLLARELRIRGQQVMVVDSAARPGAWRASVGLLNPVRGPRYTLAWRAREAFAVARGVYGSLPPPAGHRWVMRELAIRRVFRDEAECELARARRHAIETAGFRIDEIESPRRGIVVSGGAVVDVIAAVESLRAGLVAAGAWAGGTVDAEETAVQGDRVYWRGGDIEARVLVVAGGANDIGHPWLRSLPLRAVKGESIVIRAPELRSDHALAGIQHLAPRPDGTWICGGTKLPDAGDTIPTPEARAELETFLAGTLEGPWEVISQAAGVRAASPDRRPIAGALRDRPRIFLLNGLGSQGVAHGPWVARLLAAHIVSGAPLPPELSVDRFQRLPGATAERWHAVEVAHAEAELLVEAGARAIDLTAGNGGDTTWLARRVGATGRVLAIDIQNAAIEATRRRLRIERLEERVELRCADHARLAELAGHPFAGRTSVVVANLGYLPGSGSGVMTQPASTCAALSASLAQLRDGGGLVVVVYPAHEGGRNELEAVQRWTVTLDPEQFTVVWHRNPAGDRKSPCVLVVRRLDD